mmetsp:Transcript_129424/g.295325  ORF Transcript_129424/g.295325 Transcript_129424/m.295325 type:complete len:295 (+) Transcript_129424:13-897(+)
MPDEGDRRSGAGAAAVRSAAVYPVRAAYGLAMQTLGRMAAAPHKLFLPENPTVRRLDLAFATRCAEGLWISAQARGWRATLMAKMRAPVANSAAGTVLFGTHEALQGMAASSGHVATGAVAGAAHGAVCAPLEIAAFRLQRTLLPPTASIAAALRASPNFVSGWTIARQLAPFCISRDTLGGAVFFASFENGRKWLRCSEQSSTRLGQVAWIGGIFTAGGVAGVMYKCVAEPFDVAVRRMAVCLEWGMSWELAARTTRRRLAAGGVTMLVPSMSLLVTTFPSSALGLLVYEYLR